MSGVSFTSAVDGFSVDPAIDLTDDSGHGIIFCGQKIYLSASFTTAQTGTQTTAAAVNYSCRILFRWKNVSLTEYIGVVTSQLQ